MGTRKLFKENLKYWRQQTHLMQEQLAEKIGYAVVYISELEIRQTFPKPETIDAICSVLEIKQSQLFEEQGCPINTVSFNKEEFAQKIVDELCVYIKADIENCLDSTIK